MGFNFWAETIPSIFAPDTQTAKRVFEFFTANIRNPHTRKAYGKAAGAFAAWCETRGLGHLRLEADGANSLELANFAPKIIDTLVCRDLPSISQSRRRRQIRARAAIVHADAHMGFEEQWNRKLA
jgi:hypothetical protein